VVSGVRVFIFMKSEIRRKSMSWSVSGIGKPRALAVKLAAQFAALDGMNMADPEQFCKNNAAMSVAATLAAFPANRLVRVEAWGSQYTPDREKPDERLHTHMLKIDDIGTIIE